MNQPNLKTKRFLLRKFEASDANEVRRLAGNYNVAKTTLTVPHPYEPGVAESWIASHSQKWEERACVVYAVVNAETLDLLDTISLVRITGKQGELGYWLGEQYWGFGYCSEAAARLIQFSFQELGLESIVAEHLTSNPASGRVMEKAGMEKISSTCKTDRNGESARVEIYEIRNG